MKTCKTCKERGIVYSSDLNSKCEECGLKYMLTAGELDNLLSKRK